MTLTLKIATQLAIHNDAPPYQVCLQKVEQFRKYLLGKDRQTDRVIPVHPCDKVGSESVCGGGGGGGGWV